MFFEAKFLFHFFSFFSLSSSPLSLPLPRDDALWNIPSISFDATLFIILHRQFEIGFGTKKREQVEKLFRAGREKAHFSFWFYSFFPISALSLLGFSFPLKTLLQNELTHTRRRWCMLININFIFYFLTFGWTDRQTGHNDELIKLMYYGKWVKEEPKNWTRAFTLYIYPPQSSSWERDDEIE